MVHGLWLRGGSEDTESIQRFDEYLVYGFVFAYSKIFLRVKATDRISTKDNEYADDTEGEAVHQTDTEMASTGGSQEYTRISEDKMNIIKYCRKSILFHNEELWIKKRS